VVVRLSAPELLSSDFLIPLLPQVRARFPDVAIELNATNRLVNLSRRDADLAFRLNRPKEGSVVGRRLVKVSSALVASASYLGARGSPTRETTQAHDFVWDTAAFDDSVEGSWRQRHAPEGKVVVRSDSAHARCAAAEAGLGVTFLPRYVVDARSRLERIATLPELPPRELWLIVHRESKRHLPVRAIATVLSELVVANRAKLDV
jgi:DNA-binding transcriptional LysR family regulator